MDELLERLDKIIELLEDIKANTMPFSTVVANSSEWVHDAITPPYAYPSDHTTAQEPPSPFTKDLAGGGPWPYQPHS